MSTASPIVQNELFSHGTVECTDMAATRRFLTEFLGLDVIRPVKEAQYMWKGGPWSVVCVCVEGGEAKDQSPDNHFKLAVDAAEDVDAAHAAALAHKDEFGILSVQDIAESDGIRSFKLQDLNRTWWEIANLNQSHFDALFERGDSKH
jgi:hypothetical protein